MTLEELIAHVEAERETAERRRLAYLDRANERDITEPEAAQRRATAAHYGGVSGALADLVPLLRNLTLTALAVVTLAACGSPLPHCPEDATLVGTGSYTDGHWSAYVCGPAVDDYR